MKSATSAEACVQCGAPVRVRKDGRFPIHSAGKANVGMAEINERCAGSDKHVDAEKRAAEAQRVAELVRKVRDIPKWRERP